MRSQKTVAIWDAGGVLIGSALFVAGLLFYESYSSRVILDRWSYSFTAVLIMAAAIWVALLVSTILKARRGRYAASRSRRMLSIAILLWGVAYFIAAADSSDAAGRILLGNFIGSQHPLAALIEVGAFWMALFAIGSFLPKRLSPKLLNVALSFATLVVLFAIGETLFRAKSVAFPATQGFPTHSAALWHRRYAESNSLGFRDDEHSVESGGRSRLLVVGDSYTFGVGVDRTEDRFGELVVNSLTASGDTDWEGINAGLGDTHTLHHIDFLQQMLVFRPQVVVLLYVFNDMDYLAPVTRRDSMLAGGNRLNPLVVLFRNSYLFQEIYIRLRKLGFMMNAMPLDVSPYADDELLQRHLRDVQRFVDIAEHAGATTMIVPYDYRIASDEVAAAIYERFTTAAASIGLPLCEMRGVFDGVAPEELRVNALDGHPNPQANRLAAARGAACVIERLAD